MKKSILLLVIFLLATGMILTGCKSNSEKVEAAEENVIDANQDLDDANEAYLAEMESYKQEVAAKIAANEKSIAEFNARVEKDKLEVKADYKQEIANLEQKNTDMKKRLDEYQATGKENWENFKAEFNSDMDALGQALKDFVTK